MDRNGEGDVMGWLDRLTELMVPRELRLPRDDGYDFSHVDLSDVVRRERAFVAKRRSDRAAEPGQQ